MSWAEAIAVLGGKSDLNKAEPPSKLAASPATAATTPTPAVAPTTAASSSFQSKPLKDVRSPKFESLRVLKKPSKESGSLLDIEKEAKRQAAWDKQVADAKAYKLSPKGKAQAASDADFLVEQKKKDAAYLKSDYYKNLKKENEKYLNSPEYKKIQAENERIVEANKSISDCWQDASDLLKATPSVATPVVEERGSETGEKSKFGGDIEPSSLLVSKLGQRVPKSGGIYAKRSKLGTQQITDPPPSLGQHDKPVKRSTRKERADVWGRVARGQWRANQLKIAKKRDQRIQNIATYNKANPYRKIPASHKGSVRDWRQSFVPSSFKGTLEEWDVLGKDRQQQIYAQGRKGPEIRSLSKEKMEADPIADPSGEQSFFSSLDRKPTQQELRQKAARAIGATGRPNIERQLEEGEDIKVWVPGTADKKGHYIRPNAPWLGAGAHDVVTTKPGKGEHGVEYEFSPGALAREVGEEALLWYTGGKVLGPVFRGLGYVGKAGAQKAWKLLPPATQQKIMAYAAKKLPLPDNVKATITQQLEQKGRGAVPKATPEFPAVPSEATRAGTVGSQTAPRVTGKEVVKEGGETVAAGVAPRGTTSRQAAMESADTGVYTAAQREGLASERAQQAWGDVLEQGRQRYLARRAPTETALGRLTQPSARTGGGAATIEQVQRESAAKTVGDLKKVFTGETKLSTGSLSEAGAFPSHILDSGAVSQSHYIKMFDMYKRGLADGSIKPRPLPGAGGAAGGFYSPHQLTEQAMFEFLKRNPDRQRRLIDFLQKTALGKGLNLFVINRSMAHEKQLTSLRFKGRESLFKSWGATDSLQGESQMHPWEDAHTLLKSDQTRGVSPYEIPSVYEKLTHSLPGALNSRAGKRWKTW